jgi:ATPases with chaperone activity, ATP-binding subunit
VSKDDLLKLNDTMKVFVIGQDSAVDQIVEAVQRASVGLKDPIKPIGSFLFAGSTGIGKSLTTKILADELIKDRDNLVTIDCSEFSSDHEYSKLIGCFVPGTKVLMESGERKNIETINIGDKVITHKGRSRNVEFVHEYDQKGEMIEITTVNSNISETMTKTHEVLAIKSKTNLDNKQFNVNNLKWVQAKDLIAGDTLVYPVCQVTEEYLKNTNLYEYADENYIYKQIKKIGIINYTGKVYDLAVEEDVSYVLDFIVHNSPNGYIGFEQGGTLTNAVMENPFSVVVFDEIEKASHKVHELLLQILEEGRLTDGKGQKVSFKDTIVIMTSNIGVSEVEDVKKTIGFGDVAKVTDDKKTKAIEKAIKKKFKPEFLNRIDSIVHFNSLSKQDYIRIIDIELYKLNENLKNNDTEFKDLTLKFDKKIKSYILKHGIDEDFGARPLKRCIEKEVATPLALKLLRDAIPLDATVLVSVLQSKVAFYIKDLEVIKKPEVHKELMSLTVN